MQNTLQTLTIAGRYDKNKIYSWDEFQKGGLYGKRI